MGRVGQFKKGGGRIGDGRTRKRGSTSRAITVYRGQAAAPVVKVVRVGGGRVAKQSRGGSRGSGRSLMKREHGSGEMMPGPFRLRSAAVAGLIGYSEAGKGLTQLADILNKLPTVGKLPKEALAGLVLNYFADRGEWFDSGAQAFLDVGAYKLGQQGFSISGEGDDD